MGWVGFLDNGLGVALLPQLVLGKFFEIFLFALFEVVLSSHEAINLFLFELLSPLLLLC